MDEKRRKERERERERDLTKIEWAGKKFVSRGLMPGIMSADGCRSLIL